MNFQSITSLEGLVTLVTLKNDYLAGWFHFQVIVTFVWSFWLSFHKVFLSSYIPPHGRGAELLLDHLSGGKEGKAGSIIQGEGEWPSLAGQRVAEIQIHGSQCRAFSSHWSRCCHDRLEWYLGIHSWTGIYIRSLVFLISEHINWRKMSDLSIRMKSSI